MPMPDDPTPGGLGGEPNDFENMNPLLAARFGEVASYLAESPPGDRYPGIVTARAARAQR